MRSSGARALRRHRRRDHGLESRLPLVAGVRHAVCEALWPRRVRALPRDSVQAHRSGNARTSACRPKARTCSTRVGVASPSASGSSYRPSGPTSGSRSQPRQWRRITRSAFPGSNCPSCPSSGCPQASGALREPTGPFAVSVDAHVPAGLEHHLEMPAVEQLVGPQAVDHGAIRGRPSRALEVHEPRYAASAVSTSAGQGAFNRPATLSTVGINVRGATRALVSGMRDHSATSTNTPTALPACARAPDRALPAGGRASPPLRAQRARVAVPCARRAPTASSLSSVTGAGISAESLGPSAERMRPARRSPHAESPCGAATRRRRVARRARKASGTASPPAQAGQAQPVEERASARRRVRLVRDRLGEGERLDQLCRGRSPAHAATRSRHGQGSARFPSCPSRSATAPPGRAASEPRGCETPSPSSSACALLERQKLERERLEKRLLLLPLDDHRLPGRCHARRRRGHDGGAIPAPARGSRQARRKPSALRSAASTPP